MGEQKRCTKCGYSSLTYKDMFCPVCGGRMSGSHAGPCDDEKEKQWNGGYHDDFSEKRKTGDYCDRRFEETYNDGQHYHNSENSEKTPAEQFLDMLGTSKKDVSSDELPVTRLVNFFQTMRGSEGADRKYKLMVLGLIVIVGLMFFGFGFLIDFCILKAVIKNKEEGEKKDFLRKMLVLCIVFFIVSVCYMVAVLSVKTSF